jgi:GH18 family chitinase/chitodextrinase
LKSDKEDSIAGEVPEHQRQRSLAMKRKSSNLVLFRIAMICALLLAGSATTAAALTTITIGETNILDGDDSGNANLLLAQSAALSQTATLQSLSFYVTSAAGKLRLGVYDASGPGGGPGAKKAETAQITPVAGWNTANVITPVALSPGNYWLAYFPSHNGLGFRVTNASGIFAYSSLAYGAMPATFSTSPTTAAGHWSFYATLTTAPDTTPPSTPSNLTATAVSASQINLSWTASTDNVGVTGYRIYRRGSLIATSSTNAYSDSGLSASTSYTYTVSAYDDAGNVSTQSNAASATTLASTPSSLWVTAYYAGWFWDWHPSPAAAVAAVDMTAMTHFVFGRYAPGNPGELLEGAGTGHQTAVEDALINKAHANNVKAIMMIGGAGDGPAWVASTVNSAVRTTFIKNILDKCVAKNYDGADIDWEENLSTVQEQNQVIALLTELRTAAAQRPRYQAPNAPFIITFPGFWTNSNFPGSVTPWHVQVASLVDQYNLMTYGMHGDWGGWSTWFFAALKGESGTHPSSIESSIQAYVTAGVPRSKLGIGIGLYGDGYEPPVTGMRQSLEGYQWGVSDYFDTWANFYTGCSGIPGGLPGVNMFNHPNGTYVWDTEAMTGYYVYNPPIPYKPASWASTLNVSILTTEDLQSIAAKGAWVKAGNAGGTIVWTINYGFVNSTVGNPPMSAIKTAFLGTGNPPDMTPPSTPANLTATAVSASQINLSWTASTDSVGVTGYRIYSGGSQIAASSTNAYPDTGLLASTLYTYTVSAYDAAGNVSAQSASASATTQAAAGSGIIPSDRVTTWNPGLNSAGGIPNRTTIYTTLNASTYGNGSQDASGGIQAAINACPVGQVVQLSAGTFTVNDYLLISKGITLRGAGAGATRLQKTNGATPDSYSAADYQPLLIIGPNRWPSSDDNTSRNLTADGIKGAYSVTVSNGSGFAAGQFVLLDADEYSAAFWQDLPNRDGAPTTVKIWASDRAVFMRHNPSDPVDDPFPESLGWFSRPGRPVNEVKEIASVNGNILTFTTPLHTSYPTSKNSQVTRYTGGNVHVKNAGVENCTVTGGSDGAVRFEAAAYSWAKGVEVTLWLGEGVAINDSFRIELRDSYLHDGAWSAPGGGGYAISLAAGSAEALVENNMILMANKMMVGRSAGAGSVVGYNYADDGHINYDLSWQEAGINGSHMVGSHDWLFEGNECFNYDSDNTHGNAIVMTVFRNHLTGFRRSFTGMSNARTAGLMFGSWWHTFVGNVLGIEGQMSGWSYENGGSQSIWSLGYDPTHWEQEDDPKVLSTVIREGNFDYLTHQVRWDTSAQTIPNSLYLSAKPAFFGSSPWPWVDAPGATKLHTLPARYCYDHGLMPTCLQAGGGGDIQAPTVSLTAPSNSSTVSGTEVTISVNASDNVGVVGVQFTLDGVNLGSEDASSPYSVAWNTRQVSNGSHTLTAVARDAAGNSNTSAAITVTVNNAPPSPPKGIGIMD